MMSPILNSTGGLSAKAFGFQGTIFNIPFPIALTNVVAWYDAGDTSSISLSGSAVTQWNDKSGNAYHVTQSTGANRPTSGTTTLNSRNVITFDGISQYLTAATASNWTFLKSNTKYLICMVVKIGNSVNPNTYMGLLNVADSATQGGMTVYSDTRLSRTRLDHLQVTSTPGSTAFENISDGAWPGNVYYNIGVLADPANATAANRSSIYKNTGAAIKNNTLTTAATTEAPARPLEIGRYTNASGFLEGAVAELVILNATGSTDANRTAIRDYFTTKWGI